MSDRTRRIFDLHYSQSLVEGVKVSETLKSGLVESEVLHEAAWATQSFGIQSCSSPSWS